LLMFYYFALFKSLYMAEHWQATSIPILPLTSTGMFRSRAKTNIEKQHFRILYFTLLSVLHIYIYIYIYILFYT